MKKKKDCGCGKTKKYRKMMGVSECFGSKTDALSIVELLDFQKNKPFKVSFNEGITVSWENENLQEKTLTPKDKMQKEKFMKDMKKKDVLNKLKKKYGEKKGKAVAYAMATNKAKKTP
jgi:hypothetical protein